MFFFFMRLSRLFDITASTLTLPFLPLVGSSITSGAAFGMEFIITFIVVLAWFSLIDSQTSFPGSVHMSTLHFGAVVALVHLIAVSIYSEGEKKERKRKKEREKEKKDRGKR